MLLESLFTFACSKKIIASIIFTIEVNSEQVRNVMKIRKPKTTGDDGGSSGRSLFYPHLSTAHVFWRSQFPPLSPAGPRQSLFIVYFTL